MADSPTESGTIAAVQEEALKNPVEEPKAPVTNGHAESADDNQSASEKVKVSDSKEEEPNSKEEESTSKEEEFNSTEEEPKAKDEESKAKEEEPSSKEEEPKLKEEVPKADSYDPADTTLDATQVDVNLDETAPSPDASMVAVAPDPEVPNAGTADVKPASKEEPVESVVAPADEYVVWDRTAAVKLRMGTGPLQDLPPATVGAVFTRTCVNHPTHPALRYKEDGKWHTINYSEYLKLVRTAARSFIKLGVTPYSSVAILGFNSVEWFLADLGVIFAGGFGVGIYATNTPDAVQYVANHAKAGVIVVENDMQLQKVLKVEDQLPDLKYIIQYKGEPSVKRDDVMSWKEFMSRGGDEGSELDLVLNERLVAQSPNKCCTLIYTSGTTGNPKGVMLSHDNLTWTANSVVKSSNYRMATESIISYLPLSHIAAQVLDIWMPITAAATVCFAQPDALKGSLVVTLNEINPTAFFGVPRVWEKIQDQLKSVQSTFGGFKKKMGAWAMGVNVKGATSQQAGGGTPFGSSVAGLLVKKARAGLGLTNAKHIYSGAAPISRETVEFMAGVNVPICEVYGLSETTGPETANFWSDGIRQWRFGSAGRPLQGAMTEVVDPDEQGNGEITMAGRNVFMGYMDEEQKTMDTFDDQHRFRSGDVGCWKDGFLFITGRIKEILITAGGENVAPVPIEDLLKAECPVISNCMLVGDRLKFLSMLICLKTEADAETLVPKNTFLPGTLQWLQAIDSSAKTVEDVLAGKDSKVDAALTAAIEAVNKRSESRAKKIAKFLILPEDFSLPGGELGPTLKLKRKTVMAKYEKEVASLYEAAAE